MKWVKLEGDYWRSRCGRFDLCPHFKGGWSVVDGWGGVRALCPTREAAEKWAEQQKHTRDDGQKFTQQGANK